MHVRAIVLWNLHNSFCIVFARWWLYVKPKHFALNCTVYAKVVTGGYLTTYVVCTLIATGCSTWKWHKYRRIIYSACPFLGYIFDIFEHSSTIHVSQTQQIAAKALFWIPKHCKEFVMKFRFLIDSQVCTIKITVIWDTGLCSCDGKVLRCRRNLMLWYTPKYRVSTKRW
jgi:hypothetical protein